MPAACLVIGQWPVIQVCVPPARVETVWETARPWTQAARPWTQAPRPLGHILAWDPPWSLQSYPWRLPFAYKTPFPRCSVLPRGLPRLRWWRVSGTQTGPPGTNRHPLCRPRRGTWHQQAPPGPLASSSLPSTPAPPRKCLFLRLCPRRRVITANAFSLPSVVTVYTPLAN